LRFPARWRTVSRMAEKPKSPQFVACKIVFTSHPKAPSPNVIKGHYREIVTSEAAKAFFGIRPVKRKRSKITNIEDGRASA
jgi:hypothetical protein